MNPTPDSNGPATTEGGNHEEDRGESCAPRGRRFRAAVRGWRRAEVPLIDPVETAIVLARDRRLHAAGTGQKFRGSIAPTGRHRWSVNGGDVLAGFGVAYLIAMCTLALIGFAAIIGRAIAG